MPEVSESKHRKSFPACNLPLLLHIHTCGTTSLAADRKDNFSLLYVNVPHRNVQTRCPISDLEAQHPGSGFKAASIFWRCFMFKDAAQTIAQLYVKPLETYRRLYPCKFPEVCSNRSFETQVANISSATNQTQTTQVACIIVHIITQ